jgi:nitrite reductase (cytochrome c-552)
MYVPYKKAGGGDLIAGFEKLNPLPYAEARKEVKHPIACIDCHDPKSMELRVTRPGFIEGIAAVKAAQGIQNYNVNEHATRQEMRSYVCGQCHVEYYFKGKEKRLTYPWMKGLKADEIYEYYKGTDHKDWEHQITGAPILKAQHPEFEMYNQGIHARSGVACADCHMPYERSGALKISNHHVRSPLLNINNACQTCHRFSEEELKNRAEVIQERTSFMRNTALDALVEFINDIDKVRKSGSAADLKPVWEHQRRAQFLLDFVEAENSMGFHAPQEAARVLLMALDDVRKGQNLLKGLSSTGPQNPAPTGTEQQQPATP